MKVRLKREIVTMGVPGTDPRDIVGTYVDPQDWNDLIAAPDVAVIDTRNGLRDGDRHVRRCGRSGHRELPRLPGLVGRQSRPGFHNKRIAMFCTGGIPVREIDGLPESARGWRRSITCAAAS